MANLYAPRHLQEDLGGPGMDEPLTPDCASSAGVLGITDELLADLHAPPESSDRHLQEDQEEKSHEENKLLG